MFLRSSEIALKVDHLHVNSCGIYMVISSVYTFAIEQVFSIWEQTTKYYIWDHIEEFGSKSHFQCSLNHDCRIHLGCFIYLINLKVVTFNLNSP